MKHLKIVGLFIVGMFLFGVTQAQKKNTIRVTFVELGSVNCMPCKAMQPVMKEIEAEYGNQVKVVFYDVWTAEGKPYGNQYKIRAIPTQVFLDKDGKEFFRHMGFFPKEEIVKVLEQQGVTKTGENTPKKQESSMKMQTGQVCE
jgi:thioredoxin 1